MSDRIARWVMYHPLPMPSSVHEGEVSHIDGGPKIEGRSNRTAQRAIFPLGVDTDEGDRLAICVCKVVWLLAGLAGQPLATSHRQESGSDAAQKNA